MPGAVEEMASTPNSQSAMDGSGTDKKRNKLGYHRTSVACGQYLLYNTVGLVSFFASRSSWTLSQAQSLYYLGAVWLIQPRSALSAKKDPVPASPRRCAKTMRKLYPVTKGMSIFPSRSTATGGEEVTSQFEVGNGVYRRLREYPDVIFANESEPGVR